MGWFNRGSGDDSESSSASPKDFSDGSASDFESGSDFSSDSSGGGLSAPGGGAAAAMGDMQQFSMALQQQILVQKVIGDLSDIAFEKCIVGKPGESLSGKEAACVHSTVNKW
eukprot:CAMPEP_0183309936 /NCGR_PEP_ID=MMETSP0160_2-20130417/27456_1 /TAXON_ID=2839 ORGANISM="Odontella Sinensis, Strain Grunow 1884" /NCGR_SAMPLE_ID=MMETSP0160_2 /ASSEMBLY_ACC=CAM_ASM_000250 /LENGTH=111 /DNA_ID=CAMNT_0025474045 /DNA_START=25 /DNA_END=357 /DNA_ORIENTATION=+